MRYLLFFFIVVPLIEMSLLFAVSDEIGGLSTIALVVLTAVIGVQILKRQGFSTLMRANQRIESGELPAQEIVEGMMLAGAGALLLTPGFITDTIGFILLAGPLRRPLAARLVGMGLVTKMGSHSSAGFTTWTHSQGHGTGSAGHFSDGDVVEGEYVDETRQREATKIENPIETNDS